ncbi:hypothetical protein DEU56DRAFT_897907 [Suillus clintonianus]|uniref:uncharacterized protein n=1 Tax=Suillus clintonianus TaxID=1904413 RepID=UPI001B85F665|nr:uncharacterized protein DEU56DRAFT_897907 [Suillus clintonianus]KAG2153843.1 hypothetical protein DEU56DRAFT_897907 [Suillus clintonianus]
MIDTWLFCIEGRSLLNLSAYEELPVLVPMRNFPCLVKLHPIRHSRHLPHHFNFIYKMFNSIRLVKTKSCKFGHNIVRQADKVISVRDSVESGALRRHARISSDEAWAIVDVA